MKDIYLLLFLFLAYSIGHSVMASRTVKNYIRSQFPGYFGLYRILYNTIQVLLFVLLIMTAPRPEGLVWQWDGYFYYMMRIIQAAALVGLAVTLKDFSGGEFSGINQLKRFLGGVKNPRYDERYELHKTGMFAVSRHPLYLFTSILFFAEPMMTVFKLLFALWLAAYFYTGSYFEERRLIAVFNDEYKNYQKQVSRILPLRWLSRKIIKH